MSQSIKERINKALFNIRKRQLVLFESVSHPELVHRIAQILGVEPRQVDIDLFSNNETRYHYHGSVRGCDVYILETKRPDSSREEIAYFKDLLYKGIDAAVRGDAERVIAITPYWWEARADKKDTRHISVGGAMTFRILKEMGASKIITFDLHNEAFTAFADRNCTINNLSALYKFAEIIKKMKAENGDVVHSVWVPDKDLERARRLAKYSGIEQASMIEKSRSANEVHGGILHGNISPNQVVHLVDDEGASFSSIKMAVRSLRRAGVGKIFVYLTFNFMRQEYLAQLIKEYKNDPLLRIDKLYFTDAVPSPNFDLSKYPFPVEIVSIADILAQAIQAIHFKESLKDIYKYENE